MNKVMLMGRLTRDPEVKYSQSENPIAIARYGIAVRRQKQGDQEVDFINILAFGKAAEFAEKWFRKGNMIAIVGRIQVSTWTDQNNVKHTNTEVVVEEQHFTGAKHSEKTTTEAPEQQGFIPITEDDDLPF